jgi:peptide-methionine (S)-S-oxide reductase
MIKKTILAGGCFWGMEDLIRKLPGVINTDVVYAGGVGDNSTYENHTGYTESVLIEYDDTQTNFKNLLDFFFQIHDPSTYNRQGNDIGESYKSIIFYNDEKEKREAEEFIDIVNKSERWSGPVVTELKPLDKYYLAEEYHQDYLVKVPKGYTCHYVREGGSYLNDSTK